MPCFHYIILLFAEAILKGNIAANINVIRQDIGLWLLKETGIYNANI